MKSIEEHIQKDKEILADPKLSEPMRRHTLEELHELGLCRPPSWRDKAGDHHDPNVLELFCEMHPDEPECLVYDDWILREITNDKLVPKVKTESKHNDLFESEETEEDEIYDDKS